MQQRSPHFLRYVARKQWFDTILLNLIGKPGLWTVGRLTRLTRLTWCGLKLWIRKTGYNSPENIVHLSGESKPGHQDNQHMY